MTRIALVLAGFLAVLLLCSMPDPVQAETGRHSSAVPSGTGYFRDAAMSTTGLALDFGSRSFRVSVLNEDSSNALLVRFVETGAVTAAELTAPADATVSDVQSVPATSEVSFPVHALGLIYDRAAGTGAVTVRWTK